MTWWKRLRDWMTGTSSFDGQGRVAVSPAPTSSRAPGSVSLTENDGDTIRGPVRGASNNDRIIRVPERSLFDDPEALMTPQDVRRRFMALRRGGIFPHHHPNEIPSRTDEFTRLIDRAMVLAGFLTDAELKEIHEISETWLKHKKAHRYAEIQGYKSAEEAVRRFRETRQQRKIQRQQESKARAAAKADRVEKWRQTNVAFLGDGVSGSLGQHQSHPERLKAAGLPLLSTPNDVAEALHIDIPELRWLAFHTEAARTSHYTQFSIPKRSGGTRLISAPKPKTARAQRWILNNIVKRLPVEPPAHGFVSNRSIVTNAKAHIGQKLVFNVDLEAFFPTITFCRVRGLLQSIGYAPSVSTVLALLCTECPRTRLQYGDDVYFAAVGERALPQGACTSPALSNAIARRLDRRLMGLCKKASWRYTRYADDLTFSSNAPETLAGVWASIRHIIKDEGFRINRKKVRIQRSGRCQKVTGIVVNDKLGLPRTEVRRLRAIIHNAENSGLASQNRDSDPKFEARLEGQLAYLAMVDPGKGLALMKKFRALPR